MSEPLHIQIVLDPKRVYAWEKQMLDSLAELSPLQYSLQETVSPADDLQPPLAYRLYARLDDALFGVADDPQAVVDFDPTAYRDQLRQRHRWCEAPGQPDFTLLLTAAHHQLDHCRKASRQGVLLCESVDHQHRSMTPPGYHEVMAQEPVSRLMLWWIEANGIRHPVASSCSSTEPFSPRRNREKIFWKGAPMVTRFLRRIAAHPAGTGSFTTLARPANDDRVVPPSIPTPQPGIADTIAPALCLAPASTALMPAKTDARAGFPALPRLSTDLLQALPRLFRFYYHAKLTREQWLLRFKFSQQPTTELEHFTEIPVPPDRIWADPHIFVKDGQYHVFIEEMLFTEDKGYISSFTIDEDGRYSTPRKVLERDYHLSYPQVFEWQGQIYMLPESSANRTVELYRCERFPDRWQRQRILLDDIEAVDASLVFHQEKWWLFCSVKPHPAVSENDELHIFHTDDLLAGAWRPHKANPVISDVRLARPAGKIHSHLGRLIRPSQNCAGIYGYGFNLNVITELSEEHYRETPLNQIDASLYPDLIGTHTYAREGHLTVVDVCKRIPRRIGLPQP